MNHPPVVSREEWLVARNELLAKEKEATRMRDAVNAQRSDLPMVEIDKDYTFEGPEVIGEKHSLLDLFEGRRQLVIYHAMFDPSWHEGCSRCSYLIDNMGHPAHLHARDTTLSVVSRAPFSKIRRFKARMGWTVPWYSSAGSDFNKDFGATRENGEMFGLSVFIRDGERIYRTYHTTLRGAEYLGSNFSYLDLTPMGRQEEWEDSPDYVPQTPPYQWWRKHDEY